MSRELQPGLSMERSEGGVVDELPNRAPLSGHQQCQLCLCPGHCVAWREFSSSVVLTVSDVTFKDAELRQLQDEFHSFRTPRGSMTIPAMAFLFSISYHHTLSFCEPVSTIKI
jgi:hypothetical protein